MGAFVYDSENLDKWLQERSVEILRKSQQEKLSSEDLLVLTLKAQGNHFQRTDIEFRNEFLLINERFEKVDSRFEKLENKMDKGFA